MAVGAHCLNGVGHRDCRRHVAGTSRRLPRHLAQPFPPLFVVTTLVNRGIIYLFAVPDAGGDQGRTRCEENLRLRTLRQTMVTVNDIVLNRFAVTSAFLDLCEGRAPRRRRMLQPGGVLAR